MSLLVAAPALAEDASAEADRILRAAADDLKTMYRALDERTFFLFAGLDVGGEFEELEILERLARSGRGAETIASACRKALASGEPHLQLVAYDLLGKAYPDEAAARLPDLYDSLGEDDVVMLAAIAEIALSPPRPEGTAAAGPEGLYELLERDLRGGDKPARVKAAMLIALTDSDRARSLAVLGLESPDADVRRWCVLSVLNAPGLLAEGGSVEPASVERALNDDDATVRTFAARQLGHAADASLLALLYPLLEDEEVAVRRAAAGSVASLLGYSTAGDKAAAKKLLKRLKAEPDGVTRCSLAEAYGEATKVEGFSKYLTDDGYWAFFSGEWREKDLDSYYDEFESGGWGGGWMPKRSRRGSFSYMPTAPRRRR